MSSVVFRYKPTMRTEFQLVLIVRWWQDCLPGKRQSNRRLGRNRWPAYSVSMGVVSAVGWMPVESGLFSSAAYRASVWQLYLRFQDGKIYRFFECPVAVYCEFVAAASKGRYFSQQIRNRFRYEMVCRSRSGNRGCARPQPSLAEQLRASVLLAKAGAIQQQDAAAPKPDSPVTSSQCPGFNESAQPRPLE